MRERLAGLTESVHSLELQIHEKRLHVARLLERVQSELGLEEDILISEYGPDQPVPVAPILIPAGGVGAVIRADDGDDAELAPFPTTVRSSAGDCRRPSASSPSSDG